MSLADRLADDLKTALRAKDERRLSVLRMLKSAVASWELAQKKTATDDDIQSLIGTQVKQRRDAAQQFRAGDREELAAQEDAEAEILTAYLPAQLSEDELRAHVAEAVATTGATAPADMGKVMGALMPKVRGKADGALVNRLVREALSG